MENKDVSREIDEIRSSMAQVIVGKTEVIDLLLTVFLSEGHALIEDVPGVGKTLLAKTFARCLGLDFRRIQFTPDLLPADITGVSVFNQKTLEFDFMPGPVFTDILLADEINRATPRTQSSLLECMEERQVTVDGVTYNLSHNFTVLATQNPVELSGTFPLPEAQLDRFLMKISIGYPSKEEEEEIVMRFEKGTHAIPQIEPIGEEKIEHLKDRANQVYISEELVGYISDITRETRNLKIAQLGVSPRGTLALARACKSYALIQGRTYVIPDDVKRLAVPVLSHRIMVSQDMFYRGKSQEEIVREILETVPVPVGQTGESTT
ncbi:MAG TPA: MoxR family ATPase [Bacillota bacterium]|nr:MoxR family ATPase [Candidatus Fermentithermobacillaceae bacterium]HOB30907.1 MoxR family ATPase [Bacillota bacterium]HOK64703.1 MoxR family ATPase [Bacillota bacterium]HOL12166.1 MoxR family ATPase [Bacillota bacterium]HOQ02204.1 MoxR family ATPase [Bacillota bacterium]